jgi:NTE family protein
MWSELRSENIFRTDVVSLGKIGLQWMGELSFGALKGTTATRSLLDTAPLDELLKTQLPFNQIQQQVEAGHLHGVAITALDYKTSTAVTFVQGHADIQMWERSRRFSETARLNSDHVMASSAIPLLFPPVPLGDRWFGDGCIRNQTPCSPALHMGAEQLFVIGVRKLSDTADDYRAKQQKTSPSVARVINVLLNSVLLDGIETDIERLVRLNALVDRIPADHQANLNFRKIGCVWIHPTDDIGNLAAGMASKLPRIIRYLLKGLGPLDDASEIVSYLLFEPDFCRKLIEMGYQDGMSRKDSIESFLLS